MWVVREMYCSLSLIDDVSYSRLFNSYSSASAFAKSRRSVLNSNWIVEICRCAISSVECVV